MLPPASFQEVLPKMNDMTAMTDLKPLWRGFEYLDHQVKGVNWMLSKETMGTVWNGVRFFGGLQCDDMGLGKTRTAIVSAREHSPEGRVLVIAPASVKLGWKREIQLVEPDAAVDVLEKGEPETPGRWTVINYDRLARFSEYLADSSQP